MSDGPALETTIVFTHDMRRLAAFYRDGLGLSEPEPTGDRHLGFTLPGVYFGFDQVDASTAVTPGAVTLWFTVDDLQATFERFEALGARVKYPPSRKPWGGFLAALHDPDGNHFGLSERRR